MLGIRSLRAVVNARQASVLVLLGHSETVAVCSERADGSKMQRARERMEAVRTAARATGPEPEQAAKIEPEEG
ncbi:hypothetical protein [Edaphobacter modestus]|uniref:hypothetical protein n=1 Tax=Edaphobacter modestus TaxID=388466 RepID=UPI00102CE151|nr:hypothetical protein [Edaphobacter modestus]